MFLIMEARYSRNIPAISESEQDLLQKKKVAILGCGGLGGYLCECSARMGIGHIVVCDGDVFEESNLNRQILSAEGNLGTLKAEAAKAYIECTNPACEVEMVCQRFSPENDAFLDGCDLILDGLDTIDSRLALEDAAAKRNIPIVHGAVRGWGGQVAIAYPGEQLLHKLYENTTGNGSKTVLPFAAAACASMQMATALRFLTGKETDPKGTLLVFDLLSEDFEKIQID